MEQNFIILSEETVFIEKQKVQAVI